MSSLILERTALCTNSCVTDHRKWVIIVIIIVTDEAPPERKPTTIAIGNSVKFGLI